MKRFVLVLGLLLSSAVNANPFAEIVKDRPMWFSEDQNFIMWITARGDAIVGHILMTWGDGIEMLFFEGYKVELPDSPNVVRAMARLDLLQIEGEGRDLVIKDYPPYWHYNKVDLVLMDDNWLRFVAMDIAAPFVVDLQPF